LKKLKSQGKAIEETVNSNEETLRTFVWISSKNSASDLEPEFFLRVRESKIYNSVNLISYSYYSKPDMVPGQKHEKPRLGVVIFKRISTVVLRK
jgi:hypothetical protein